MVREGKYCKIMVQHTHYSDGSNAKRLSCVSKHKNMHYLYPHYHQKDTSQRCHIYITVKTIF